MEAVEEKKLVMKFGGTSVGSPESLAQVVSIIKETRTDWPQLVVVISALSGITDILLGTASKAEQGNLDNLDAAQQQMLNRHSQIAEALISSSEIRDRTMSEIEGLLGEFSNLCRAITVLGEATPRALDAVASLGERMSVRLLSAALQDAGVSAKPVEASNLIITDDCFQNAHPDLDETSVLARRFLDPLLQERIVPVVTGFMAATKQGVVTTLGRGGSDFTAGILGAVLPAEEVWIWSDVDGVMSADPRVVPSARTILELTYREVAELAYYGAKVLHPKTIRPVIEAGVKLRICNTFNPSHPGTRLVDNGGSDADGIIKAVTAIRGQKLITIEGRGMLGVPGVAARAFAAVASTGTSVPLITQASSEQSICFAVPANSATHVVSAVESAFASELLRRDIDRIWASDEVVIVTVVGSGLIHTPGIAGKIFNALGLRHVNVIAIAQGSSEVLISLVVDQKDANQAVSTIHELIVPI